MPLAEGLETQLLFLLSELVDLGAAHFVHEELSDALDSLLQVFYPAVQRVELVLVLDANESNENDSNGPGAQVKWYVVCGRKNT